MELFSTADGGAANIPQGDILLVNNLNGLPLTADQEFQAGLTCNGVAATPTNPLPAICPASQLGSSLVKIPAPFTENDDHNPQRIARRSLFDLAVGQDNLFNGERFGRVCQRWTTGGLRERRAPSARVSAISAICWLYGGLWFTSAGRRGYHRT